MSHTEELMLLKMDSARNTLASLSTIFTAASACIAAGGLMPGMFGEYAGAYGYMHMLVLWCD